MAEKYVIQIDVTGKSEQQLRKIGDAIRNVQTAHSEATSKIKDDVEGLNQSFDHLKETILAAFAVERVIEFGRHILDVTAEFEGFRNVINYSSLNSIDAQKNMQFLGQSIADLNIPMQQAYQGFSEMQAGLKGTGVEGERLRGVFKGFETMARVLHMPDFQHQRVFYDLKEITERGINRRNIMGLSGAGVPVASLIKNELHKSIEELEKTMSGGEFIVHLGDAMQKAYQSGLEKANESLPAQMAKTQNEITETILKMGETLRPVFLEIMNGIRNALSGDTVQFFINHMQELVKIIYKAGEVWLFYNAGVMGASLAMKAYEGVMVAVEAVQMTAMFGVEGMTVALEGMGAALATTGIGAFAVALGLLVTQVMDFNKEFDASIEKITHAQELTNKDKGLSDRYNQSIVNFRTLRSLDKSERNDLYSGNESLIKDLSKEQREVSVRIQDASKSLLTIPQTLETTFTDMGGTHKSLYTNPKYTAVYNDLQKNQALAADINSRISTLQVGQRELGKLGVTGQNPYSAYLNPEEHKGHKKGALSLVDMTGAKGGLGEAKQIFINIHGPLQQNVGVKESAGQANGAVQLLTRAINNLSSTQSQTY